MSVFTILTLLFATVQFSYAEQPVLCQFHLNQSSLIKSQPIKGVKVKTFAPTNDQTGKEAFEDMIKKSGKCDGLIISGHHLGHFAHNDIKLVLKDIEKLSCDDKYKDWFNQVKSLWLLGCNTVADKYIKSQTDRFKINPKARPNKRADAEAARLLYKGAASEQDIPHLQHGYSAVMDEFSPLSSRYLRAFPKTKIYGFENAAPESNDTSDDKIIKNHIKDLTAAIAREEKSQKKNYKTMSAIEVLFSGDTDYCDDSLEAWESRYTKNAAAVENQDFKDVYKLGCDFIKQKQILDDPNSSKTEKNKAKKQILAVLKEINAKDKGIDVQNKYSYLLFNNIYETWLYAKRSGDTKFQKKLKKLFKEKNFTETLEQRINSPFTGTMRVVDTLKFYSDIHKGNSKKEAFVKNKVDGILTERVGKLFNYLVNVREGGRFNKNTGRKLSAAVVDQLSQYDLLSEKQIEKLLKNKKVLPASRGFPYSTKIRLQLMSQLPANNQKSIVSLVENALQGKGDGHLATTAKRNKQALMRFATENAYRKNDVKTLSKLLSLTQKYDKDQKSKLKEKHPDKTEEEIERLTHNLQPAIAVNLSFMLERDYEREHKKQANILLRYLKQDFGMIDTVLFASDRLFLNKQKKNLIYKQICLRFKSKLNVRPNLKNHILKHFNENSECAKGLKQI